VNLEATKDVFSTEGHVNADAPVDGPQAAEVLQEQNPQWLVLFGSWTRDLVAFPLFRAPPGAYAAAKDAESLTQRMRQVERQYGYQGD